MIYNTDYIDNIHKNRLSNDLSRSYLADGNPCVKSYENCTIEYTKGTIIDNISNNYRKGLYIYIGHMMNIWGHCITDNLKKIWFLKTDEYKILKENHNVRLCCTSYKQRNLIPNFIKLLNLLDINASSIEIITNNTTFEKIYIPDDSIFIKDDYRYYYVQYKETINEILSKIPFDSQSPKRIYFTRTGIKGNKDYGEKNIENIFSKIGYKIVSPEKIPFEEQMKLLKNCDSFASTEGSISHNVVFCRDSVENIVIRKSCMYCDFQYFLMDIRNANVQYIDAHLSLFSIFAVWNGPFFIYINENVVNFAHHYGLYVKQKFPKCLFIKYLITVLYQSIRYRTIPLPTMYFSFYSKKLKKCLFS